MNSITIDGRLFKKNPTVKDLDIGQMFQPTVYLEMRTYIKTNEIVENEVNSRVKYKCVDILDGTIHYFNGDITCNIYDSEIILKPSMEPLVTYIQQR